VTEQVGGSPVRFQRDGAILRLTLARPDKKNALDRPTVDALRQAFASLAGDADVRVVVLAGEGDDFCAGADLGALSSMIDAGPEVHRDDARALGDVLIAMRSCAVPVVAAVRGRALAGGAGLATACDIVLAHENASFGYPEVRIGFVPAMVMTLLRRTVAEKHAADLVLSGRLVGAQEARDIGLVSRVIPDNAFDVTVAETVESLAKSPPGAMRLTKGLFYALDFLDVTQGIAAGVETNVEARATDEFRSGVRRFLARSTRSSG
jgi:methylglutaconyl-CoA hydratase